MDIKDIIARRSDLGSFLVHLTRDQNGDEGAGCLEGILRDKKIEARRPFGCAVKRLENQGHSANSQKCVCFTETPLQYVHLLIEEIDGRDIRFMPYGIAITRQLARIRSINPVWYIDITPRHTWLSNNVNNLIDAAILGGSFDRSDIARLSPFIETMGTGRRTEDGQLYRKEFWWEREWRHVGDLILPERLIVLCPEADFDRMKGICDTAGLFVAFIDPSWGIEQIIARLSGFEKGEIEVV